MLLLSFSTVLTCSFFKLFYARCGVFVAKSQLIKATVRQAAKLGSPDSDRQV
jgi:hypothetical protein